MAKKSSLNVLYLVGMALVALGFVLPIFQFSSILGKHQLTGFDLVGDGDTALKIYTLLIFIGGIAGVVLSFVKVQNAKLLKLAALLVSIIGFVLVVVSLVHSDGAAIIKGLNLGKKTVSFIFKSLYAGGYMIIAGWIGAAIGVVTGK